MSTVTSQLASLVLSSTECSAVADVMFPYADAVTSQLLPGTALSDGVAAAYVRAPADQAMLAVSGVRSPELLDRFARHPSIQVRRRVAAHPQVSAATVSYLWEYATKRRDPGLRAACLRRMPAAEALRLLGERRDRGRDMRDSLTPVLRQRGMYEDFVAAASDGGLDVRVAGLLALWGGSGVMSGDDYLRLVSQHRPEDLGRCLVTALAAVRTLTADVVSQTLAWAPDVEPGLFAQHPCPNATAVTADAARLLVGGDALGLWRTVLLVSQDEDVLSELVAAGVVDYLRLLLTREDLPERVRGGLTAAVAEHGDSELVAECVSSLLAGASQRTVAEESVVALQADLPDSHILKLLRMGHRGITTQWLYRKLSLRVSAQLVRDLLAEPGSAFGRSDRHFVKDLRVCGSYVSRAVFAAHAGTDVVDAFVDALGPAGLPVLLKDSVARQWVYQQMHAAFGDDPRVWGTAVQLAEQWDGSFADLLRASCLVLEQ